MEFSSVAHRIGDGTISEGPTTHHFEMGQRRQDSGSPPVWLKTDHMAISPPRPWCYADPAVCCHWTWRTRCSGI